MFTGQTAETILPLPPFTAKHCMYTHTNAAKEYKEQLQKNIKPEDNLSVLLRKAQGSEPKHL